MPKKTAPEAASGSCFGEFDDAREFDPEAAAPAQARRFREAVSLGDALLIACAARDPEAIRRAIARGARPNLRGWTQPRQEGPGVERPPSQKSWRRGQHGVFDIALWRMAEHTWPAPREAAARAVVGPLNPAKEYASFESEDQSLLDVLAALAEGGWDAQGAAKRRELARALQCGAGQSALWLLERIGLAPDEAVQGFALSMATACSERAAERLRDLGASLGDQPAGHASLARIWDLACEPPLFVARATGAWPRAKALADWGAPIEDMAIPDRTGDPTVEDRLSAIESATSRWRTGLWRLPGSDFGEPREDAVFEELLRSKRDELALRETLAAEEDSARRQGEAPARQGSPRL
jgi:hypothetical protein